MSSTPAKVSKPRKAAVSVPAASVPATVPAPVAAAAPAKASKATVTAVVASVAAPVVAVAPVAAAPSTEAAEQVNITAEFTSLVEQVNTLRATLSTVFSNMKKLEKQIPRELKKASKGGRRRKVEGATDGPKKETVFTRAVPISDALCTFLGLTKGSLLSRSEVTSRVCSYAKTNQLMDKQIIKADPALRKLLALSESDELKILNLQRYLKPHYPKAAVVPPATA